MFESWEGGMLKYNFFDASEDVGRNATNNDTMGDIIARRLGRRDILRGSLAVAAITAAYGLTSGLLAPGPAAAQAQSAADDHRSTHLIGPSLPARIPIRVHEQSEMP